MFEEIDKILKKFNDIPDIELNLNVSEGRATYQILKKVNNENKIIVDGKGDNLLDVALKAQEDINHLLSNK